MTKKKSPLTKQTIDQLVQWEKIVPKSVLPIEKTSRAGVIVDRNGAPHFFIFDAFALLDVLSAIDDKLVDRLSTEAYHSKTINPAGWLIDHIEERLPLNPVYIQSLRDAITDAQKKGWIPFNVIEQELKLRS